MELKPKVRSVLKEMLIDRGYKVEGDKYLYKNEFCIGDVLVMFLTKKESVNKKLITKLHSISKKKGIKNFILITNKKSKVCDESIEIFLKSDLNVNVTKIPFIPKHVKLNQEESDKLISDLELSDKYMLPKIKIYDSICKYYGGKIGDIFRVERTYPRISIYYRVVTC